MVNIGSINKQYRDSQIPKFSQPAQPWKLGMKERKRRKGVEGGGREERKRGEKWNEGREREGGRRGKGEWEGKEREREGEWF